MPKHKNKRAVKDTKKKSKSPKRHTIRDNLSSGNSIRFNNSENSPKAGNGTFYNSQLSSPRRQQIRLGGVKANLRALKNVKPISRNAILEGPVINPKLMIDTKTPQN